MGLIFFIKRKVFDAGSIKKKYKNPKPGDIFTLQIRPGEFAWGRVVRDDAILFWGDITYYLIYIYSKTTSSKSEILELKKEDILFPPRFINKLPWSKGYFETIENRELSESDVFEKHCFQVENMLNETYYDEYNNSLPNKLEPCGTYSLYGYGSIYYEICNKLGIK